MSPSGVRCSRTLGHLLLEGAASAVVEAGRGEGVVPALAGAGVAALPREATGGGITPGAALPRRGAERIAHAIHPIDQLVVQRVSHRGVGGVVDAVVQLVRIERAVI